MPDKFVQELISQVEPFCEASGHASLKEAQVMVGRAARVAQVIPEVLPFSSALWAALTGSLQAQKTGHREAPPGRVPHRRFNFGARWLRALLRGGEGAPFLLERLVTARGPTKASTSSWAVLSDASPWGGGAVLVHDGQPVEYTRWVWNDESAAGLGVEVGKPKDQSFWEFLTIALSVVLWGGDFVHQALALITDNTAALQQTLDLKGKGPMLEVALELSWRKARGRLQFTPGHLPSEQNKWADALSRLAAPTTTILPKALAKAREREAPDPANFWCLRA